MFPQWGTLGVSIEGGAPKFTLLNSTQRRGWSQVYFPIQCTHKRHGGSLALLLDCRSPLRRSCYSWFPREAGPVLLLLLLKPTTPPLSCDVFSVQCPHHCWLCCWWQRGFFLGRQPLLTPFWQCGPCTPPSLASSSSIGLPWPCGMHSKNLMVCSSGFATTWPLFSRWHWPTQDPTATLATKLAEMHFNTFTLRPAEDSAFELHTKDIEYTIYIFPKYETYKGKKNGLPWLHTFSRK